MLTSHKKEGHFIDEFSETKQTDFPLSIIERLHFDGEE